MEVYLEITYLLHLFITYLSLMSTLILLDIDMDKKERFIFTLGLSFTFFNLFLSIPTILILFYDLLIAYHFIKQKSLWFTFLYSVSLMIYQSFFKTIQKGSVIKEGVFIYSISSSLWLHTLLCFIFFLFYGAYLSHYLDVKKEKHYLKNVLFSYRHKIYRCKAFYDSGNRVEYLNRPVLFIRESLIENPLYIGKVEIKTVNQVSKKNVILLDFVEVDGRRRKYLYGCLIEDLDYEMLLNGKL